MTHLRLASVALLVSMVAVPVFAQSGLVAVPADSTPSRLITVTGTSMTPIDADIMVWTITSTDRAIKLGEAKAGYGESYLLITVLAAVLGGTSPTGGFGRVTGLLLALAILQVISSGLNLLRVSPFLAIALWGVTILLVMAIHRFLPARATR